MKIISIDNQEINTDCLGCSIANKEISGIGGIIYESEYFIVSQDFEIPILGFMVISSKRHISNILDFSKAEFQDFTEILLKTRKALKQAVSINIVNIIQKESRSHFHLWFLPLYQWMEPFGDKLKGISEIIQYAKQNLKTEQNLKEILDYSSKIKDFINTKN